jgi:ATP-dependent RNA helicase DHX29
MVCGFLSTHLSDSHTLDVEPRVVDKPSEEKALTRLAVTYGILRRLGFSEERVEQCLRAIPGVDLDEAYEWVGR